MTDETLGGRLVLATEVRKLVCTPDDGFWPLLTTVSPRDGEMPIKSVRSAGVLPAITPTNSVARSSSTGGIRGWFL